MQVLLATEDHEVYGKTGSFEELLQAGSFCRAKESRVKEARTRSGGPPPKCKRVSVYDLLAGLGASAAEASWDVARCVF